MKILFFSDIHGIKKNLNKLKKVINNENPDKIVVLGDLYYQGFNEVVKGQFDNKAVYEFLHSYKDRLIVLKGNCDLDIDIKKSKFKTFFDIYSINVDGFNIYLTHGNVYNYDSSKFNKKGVLVYGHEHIPYIRVKDNITYICVGSISLPRNDFGSTYVIYNNREFTIYNIDGELIDQYKIKEEI